MEKRFVEANYRPSFFIANFDSSERLFLKLALISAGDKLGKFVVDCLLFGPLYFKKKLF